MNKSYAKDLFQLQTELIDTKVDMAVSKAVDRVIDQIIDLKVHMNNQFREVNQNISYLENRMTKLESRVDIIEKEQNSIANLLTELLSKVIASSFRGGWVILAGIVLLLVGQASQLFHFYVQ